MSPGLNQQELANLLGVHRVTLNKALRELEREAVLGPYCGMRCTSWIWNVFTNCL
ncbi:MAG: helix-turn-helix domain-containing protein [Bilophila wadsworthia]